jgi:hypothetical protein
MKTPATIPGNDGAPPPMKMARREVPLPSQENKKGAMQYALYAIPNRDFTVVRINRLMLNTAPPSIKSPTGPVRVPSGP